MASLVLQEDESAGSSSTSHRASPHSQLRKDTDQTPRMLAAVGSPVRRDSRSPAGTDVQHPAPASHADWRKVFKEPAARNVAIELDATAPSGYRLRARPRSRSRKEPLRAARQRRAQHCRFPFHRLRNRARAADRHIPSNRVVNCWEESKFAQRGWRNDEWPGHGRAERHGEGRLTSRHRRQVSRDCSGVVPASSSMIRDRLYHGRPG